MLAHGCCPDNYTVATGPDDEHSGGKTQTITTTKNDTESTGPDDEDSSRKTQEEDAEGIREEAMSSKEPRNYTEATEPGPEPEPDDEDSGGKTQTITTTKNHTELTELKPEPEPDDEDSNGKTQTITITKNHTEATGPDAEGSREEMKSSKEPPCDGDDCPPKFWTYEDNTGFTVHAPFPNLTEYSIG